MEQSPEIGDMEEGGDWFFISQEENELVISLTGPRIKDLTPLSRLPKLTRILLKVTQITDLSPLTGLKIF